MTNSVNRLDLYFEEETVGMTRQSFLIAVLIIIAASLALVVNVCSAQPPNSAVTYAGVREGARFEIGGEVLLEFVDAQSNDAPDNNPHPYFHIEFFMLAPHIRFSDNISVKAEIEFEPDEVVLLNELHADFDNLPLNSWLKIGMEDRFIKRSRITETYPINQNIWQRGDDTGIQWGGATNFFYWRTSITNGKKLKIKKQVRDSAFPILKEGRINESKITFKEIGVGLGKKFDLGNAGSLDLLGFHYHGKLSDDDMAVLQDITGYGASTNDQSMFGGFNLDCNIRSFNLFGQFITAMDGELNRTGWYIQPSYKFSLPGLNWNGTQAFMGMRLLARYSQLNLNLPAVSTDSLTWDREITTLALILDVVKNTKLKMEYSIMGESPGGSSVDNNELLIQLFFEF